MAVNLIYKALPTIALRGIVVFPGTNFHFDVGRKKSVAAVKAAMNDNQKIFLVAQKDINVENPETDDLYRMGVVANIRQVIKAPDGKTPREGSDDTHCPTPFHSRYSRPKSLVSWRLLSER